MTALTPDTYPFDPYPPFKDPADWRPAITFTERDVTRAREFAADASGDHLSGQHAHHDHPWCQHCRTRLVNAERQQAGLDPLVTPDEADQYLKEAGCSAQDDRYAELKALRDDGVELVYDEVPVELHDVDLERYQAWLAHLEELDEWHAHEIESRDVTIRRAARYLIVHGRAPVDPGPPTAGVDFDEQYLGRDELDTLPAPEPLIEGVLTRHSYGILRGRDDSFKSFVALDWGLSLTVGRTWQGHPAQTVRVLYIAGEGAYGLANRVASWEEAWNTKIPADMLTIRATALNMFKPGPAFDHLLHHVTVGGYGLVIIDTLRRVAGAADGNSSEMGAVVDNIDRLKQATDNGSVLVVAHTDKSDKDSRGYSGIEDDADVVWHAKRDDMNLHLENTKMKDGRGGKIHRLHATVVGPSLVLEQAGATIPVATESQIKLLDTIRTIFPNGARPSQLLETSELSKSTFYRALAALQEAGHIVDIGTKHRPFYEHVKSHEVPAPQTPSDLRNSHESHEVPRSRVEGPTGPTALIGGTWDQADTNTTNQEVS